jgi:hypothetical protein
MPSEQDKQALQLFQQLSDKLQAADSAGAADSPVDFCKTYSGLRSVLQGALTFIGLIPIYGGTIVSAIKLLMQIADSTCKINT